MLYVKCSLSLKQLKNLPVRPATLPEDLLAGWGQSLWVLLLGWLAQSRVVQRWVQLLLRQVSLLAIRWCLA
jgi:hypothetical protein